MSVVAAWPAPNLTNPETRGPINIVVGSVLVTLTTFVVTIRLISRRWISHGFGRDDLLMIAAWLPATAFTVGSIVSELTLGFNRHIWDMPPGQTTRNLKLA